MAAADKGWMPLDIDFTTTADELKLGIAKMPAAWTLFLLGDGSPTLHLGLLTGYTTEVDVLSFDCIGDSPDQAPTEIQDIEGPRHRRQVYLRNTNGERLGYAASWWHSSDIEALFGTDKTLPIGRQITTKKKELFRDIKHIFRGHSVALEKEFGMQGPFWGRSYLFWQGGRPITLIYEVFSPRLQKYLGEIDVPARDAVAGTSTSSS